MMSGFRDGNGARIRTLRDDEGLERLQDVRYKRCKAPVTQRGGKKRPKMGITGLCEMEQRCKLR